MYFFPTDIRSTSSEKSKDVAIEQTVYLRPMIFVTSWNAKSQHCCFAHYIASNSSLAINVYLSIYIEGECKSLNCRENLRLCITYKTSMLEGENHAHFHP